MSRQPSWQDIAHRLGERLSYAVCEFHGADDAEPEECPFCDDIAAHAAYVAKCRAADVAPEVVAEPSSL